MYLSGFDEYLKTIDNNPNYLYAGYSAGICVLEKDMHVLDICDNHNINPYGIDTMWKIMRMEEQNNERKKWNICNDNSDNDNCIYRNYRNKYANST